MIYKCQYMKGNTRLKKQNSSYLTIFDKVKLYYNLNSKECTALATFQLLLIKAVFFPHFFFKSYSHNILSPYEFSPNFRLKNFSFFGRHLLFLLVSE